MEDAASTDKKSVRRQMKPNNVVTVPTSFGREFFKWWCIFLRPFVNLTDREVQVVSCLLKERYELSKCISDPVILDKMVMGEDTRQKIQKECKISPQHLCVVLNKLRKSKVIVNNMINPRLIPNIRTEDNGCFQLLVLFKEKQDDAG